MRRGFILRRAMTALAVASLVAGCSQDNTSGTATTGGDEGVLCPTVWVDPGSPPPPRSVTDGIYVNDIQSSVDFDDEAVLAFIKEHVAVADRAADGQDVAPEEQYGMQALRGSLVLKITDDCNEGSEWWLRLDDPIEYRFEAGKLRSKRAYYGWAAWSDAVDEWVSVHYGRSKGEELPPSIYEGSGTYYPMTWYVENAEIWQRADMNGPPAFVVAGVMPSSGSVDPVVFQFRRPSAEEDVTATPRAAFYTDRSGAVDELVAEFQTNGDVFPDSIAQ